MSGREHRPARDCAEVSELVPELALGLLDGAERAEVLAHVGDCSRCRADLAALTEVGEDLLLLTPEAEPPAHFESRVLARLDRRVGRLRSRWWWFRTRPALAAAAALVVVLALVAGLLTFLGDEGGSGDPGGGDQAGADAPDGILATVDMLNDDGDVVATAAFHAGTDHEPGMLAVDMADWVAALEEEGVPTDGEWWLILEDTDGEPHRYQLPIRPSVAVPLVHGPEAAEALTAAITTGDGRTLCQGEVEQSLG